VSLHNINLFEWLQPLLFLLIIGSAILLILKQTRDLKMMEERAKTKKVYYTVIECGEKTVRREFREGDFVGKRTSECNEGSEGLIVSIYVEEQQPEKQVEVKSPGRV
jgi:hypothetical protein